MSNHLTRRHLLERLKQMGMCPDVKNDEEAVRLVAEQTGQAREEIARELVEMRAEQGMRVFKAYGITMPPQAFQGCLAAMRDALSDALADKKGQGKRFYDSLFAQTPETTRALLADTRAPLGKSRVRKAREAEIEDIDRRHSNRMDFEIEMP